MSDELISDIRALVGDAGLLTGDAVSGRSAGIWSSAPLEALALVRPRSTDEVAGVLRLCHAAGQSVIPVGGMTGLAGAHESGPGDILLSTERMNRIDSIDAAGRSMVVEAGAVLQQVQEAAADAGLYFALDLGARASCTIGGNIATNAGGVRVLRYGMMREQLLGIEVVLADGQVVSSMFNLLKNNTGYDLRQLFVGSEGTLGVITRAVLRLHEAPPPVQTALLAVPGWREVMSLLRFFDAGSPGALAACEVMWANDYELNTGEYSDIDPPLDTGAPYYLLIDMFSADREVFEDRLAEGFERGEVVDGVVAQSEAERQILWRIREDFEPEQRRFESVYGYDVSLPIQHMESLVETLGEALRARDPAAELFAYGHVGDGNLHYSIFPASLSRAEVDELVYRPLETVSGSISAEHGIGIEKKPFLHYTRSAAEIELMRRVKKMLDPDNLLNPGKLFDL
ncbi:MAG: FAD-binding oxidoreductase [Gammaproteobacteria bacterium]|jgi:FAD/FMN-containing dehydrogenase